MAGPLTVPPLTAAERKRLPRLYKRGQSPLLLKPPQEVVRAWTFAHGLPTGWSGHQARFQPSPAGLRVVTSAKSFAYELTGPVFTLPRGTYEVVLRAKIGVGGIGVGALDISRKRCCWLGYKHYWYGQKGVRSGLLGVRFKIGTTKRVGVVLANWGIGDRRSSWLLRRIVVARG